MAKQTGPIRESIIVSPANIPEDLQTTFAKSAAKNASATAQLQKWNIQISLSQGKIQKALYEKRGWREVREMINAERLNLEASKNPLIFMFDQNTSVNFLESGILRTPRSQEVDLVVAEHVAILDQYNHPDASILIPAIRRLKGSIPETRLNQYLMRAKTNANNWLEEEGCEKCTNQQMPEVRIETTKRIKKALTESY